MFPSSKRSIAPEQNQTFSIYMPFFTGNGMSERSKDLRAKAAQELRTSRNGGTPSEKADNKKRASELKSLAENEEWLEGEKGRLLKPTRKQNY